MPLNFLISTIEDIMNIIQAGYNGGSRWGAREGTCPKVERFQEIYRNWLCKIAKF